MDITAFACHGVGVSNLTRKKMTIVGSRASVDYFPEALKLMASGAVTYPKVATRFSMWDAPNRVRQFR